MEFSKGELRELYTAVRRSVGYLDPLRQSRHEQRNRLEQSASDCTHISVYDQTPECVQAHLASIERQNNNCKLIEPVSLRVEVPMTLQKG